MLLSLVGNKSAVNVMLSLYEHGELHASAIAKEHSSAVDPIIKQLERFEGAGFLLSRSVGRSKLYKFNSQNPAVFPLIEIIKIYIHNNEVQTNEIQ
jgi:GTP-sensing pleiotropic transcriptional regulator CodY